MALSQEGIKAIIIVTYPLIERLEVVVKSRFFFERVGDIKITVLFGRCLIVGGIFCQRSLSAFLRRRN